MEPKEARAYVHLVLGSVGFGVLMFFFYMDAYNPNVSIDWYVFVAVGMLTAALLKLDMSEFPWSLFKGI